MKRTNETGILVDWVHLLAVVDCYDSAALRGIKYYSVL